MTTQSIALTIAGFDTSAGAGLQADLLTLHNHGYHTVTAVTTLVVETPLEVVANEAVCSELLARQISLLLATYPVSTVKIGLLTSPSQVAVLVKLLGGATFPIVLDPVGISSSGTRLQEEGTGEALLRTLAPLVTVMTPNLPEACALLGEKVGERPPETVASDLARHAGCAVLLTGGHHGDPETVSDLLVCDGEAIPFASGRIETPASLHGTGCVLSSALAATLGQGLSLPAAVASARGYLRKTLSTYLSIDHSQPLLALNHHLPTSHDE